MKNKSPKHESTDESPCKPADWRERLRQLGIAPKRQLYNLTVAPGATVELRDDHPCFKQCFVDVPIRDLSHFVDLCGPGLRFEPQPNKESREKATRKRMELPQHLTVRRVPDKFRRVAEHVGRTLIGEKVQWTEDEISLGNQWVSKWKLSVLALADIYVHSRGQLILGSGVTVARYVTVERFGQIVVPPASHTKIDCAGMEGSKRVLPTTVTVSGKFSLTQFVS